MSEAEEVIPISIFAWKEHGQWFATQYFQTFRSYIYQETILGPSVTSFQQWQLLGVKPTWCQRWKWKQKKDNKLVQNCWYQNLFWNKEVLYNGYGVSLGRLKKFWRWMALLIIQHQEVPFCYAYFNRIEKCAE
jgi:hypothetical protein